MKVSGKGIPPENIIDLAEEQGKNLTQFKVEISKNAAQPGKHNGGCKEEEDQDDGGYMCAEI